MVDLQRVGRQLGSSPYDWSSQCGDYYGMLAVMWWSAAGRVSPRVVFQCV